MRTANSGPDESATGARFSLLTAYCLLLTAYSDPYSSLSILTTGSPAPPGIGASSASRSSNPKTR